MNRQQAPPKRFNLYYLYCDDEKHNHLSEQRLAEMHKALLQVCRETYGDG